MNTTRSALNQALATARRLGAARPGPARRERAAARMEANAAALPLVALGPDSTDKTSMGRAMARARCDMKYLCDSLEHAREVEAMSAPDYAAAVRLTRQLVELIGIA